MNESTVWEVSPTPNNPRNSEGAFLDLGESNILFCCTSFTGEHARDYTAADIARMTSLDGGRTWTAPSVILRASDHGAINIMSVSLFKMRGGDIGMFYLVRRSWTDMRIVLRRSDDEGLSWSPPADCTPRTGYFVMNNDRAVRLSSGRILLPAAEHSNTVTEGGKPLFSAATVTFFYSDDDGLSWRESSSRLLLSGIRSSAGLQEPGVVELKNGLLYGWARTDLGVQYEFFSRDGGENWSAATPSHFSSPLSPLSMKRIADGRLLALWNPIPEYLTRNSDKRNGGRTPLVFSLSGDEALSWPEPQILEDDPQAGYCYTAILPLEDAVLLAYCAGDIRRDPSCLNRLRIRRVPLTSLVTSEIQKSDDRMGIGF